MKKMSFAPAAGAFLLVLGVAGCAWDTPTDISASYSVYSNYDDKIPGKYALYVDAEKMKRENIESAGFECWGYSYPVDAREGFTQSVHGTFANLLEEVEVVDEPVSFTDLEARGLDGVIRIEVEDLDADLFVIDGFWIAEIEADAEITATIQVIGREGHLLGSTVEGSEDHRTSAGLVCEGGSDALSGAVEAAAEETIERLGERLVNSERVRAAAPKGR